MIIASEEQITEKVIVLEQMISQTVEVPTAVFPSKADEVKIMSFFAPKTGWLVLQQTNNTKAVPVVSTQKNSHDVVFCEGTKNTAILGSSNYQNSADIEFKSYKTVRKSERSMLNCKVPTLQLPFHIITVGENLFSISVQYNVKLQKLLQWNGLKESDRVMDGSKIYLNDPNVYYEIKAGDSLYDIATQRHVLIDELMR
ncbi:hypothetical protein PSDI105340_06475 [Pseudoalteromonas distincta]